MIARMRAAWRVLRTGRTYEHGLVASIGRGMNKGIDLVNEAMTATPSHASGGAR